MYRPTGKEGQKANLTLMENWAQKFGSIQPDAISLPHYSQGMYVGLSVL